MSACVDTMFSVRETPWHGLGVIVQDAPTSADAIRMAELNWRVEQSNIYMADGTLIDGYKANYRDKDNLPLGIVSDKYKIVQNDEAFAFTDELLGEGIRYETAGSLSDGRRTWLLAKMETCKLVGDDCEPYLVFTNTHDGTGSIRVALTPIRVVCQNTLNLALSKARRQWSCVHKGNITSKMEEAKMTLLNANNYIAELQKEAEALSRIKMDKDKVVKTINTLLPINDADNTRKVCNINDMRTELLFRYFSAPDLKDTEHTAFRFINAVSDFATHRDAIRNTTSYKENLFYNTVSGNKVIDLAYELVKTA